MLEVAAVVQTLMVHQEQAALEVLVAAVLETVLAQGLLAQLILAVEEEAAIPEAAAQAAPVLYFSNTQSHSLQ
jgi:hypothetical protein